MKTILSILFFCTVCFAVAWHNSDIKVDTVSRLSIIKDSLKKDFDLKTHFNYKQNRKVHTELNKVIDITSINETDYLGDFFSFVEDSLREFNKEIIVKQQFRPISNAIINFGFSNSTHWLKFSMENSSSKKVEKLLYIQKPLQDSITLFYYKDKVLRQFENGYMIKDKDRSNNGLALYFPLSLNANETQTYFLKCNSKYGKAIAANIVSEATFHQRERMELIAVCLLIGALLTLSIYNVFLGFALKDRLYGLYAFAISGSLVTQLAARGFMKMYLIPDSAFILKWSPVFFISLGTIALSLFCVKFLNTKRYSKIAHRLLWGVIFYMVIALIIEVFISEIFNIYCTNALVAIGLMAFGFVALFSGIMVYLKGNKSARYFIYAWTIYCVTIVIYVLTLLAWLPINAFTTNAYMVGSLVEVTLLSLALGDRYDQLRKEKKMLLSTLVTRDEDILAKKQEIMALMTESIRHLKNKLQLAENLKKLNKAEEGVTLKNILVDLLSESYDDKKLLLTKETIDFENAEFIKKLKERHPNLSPTDVEVITLIKIGLSRKEVAKFRQVSLETVKSSRFRIKKKLNLSKDIVLDDYVKSL
ncbi:LuxR C-terminal-related transcriptional regulator [Tamlana agarivorans]|uniref:LuxR C-terminal-related transcriptional regulator n=1 Tax=Pseudotamlana agarivorans TaxID=481183 RepID=A0ACC5U6L8_9FLAO|nr:7TM diverse intracellular signaling domain-containing protein [Tamlana agarivorans]MBU2949894.1 LuxR C-terminal-related transcriptional regulator [Tamlana agarivorans]